MQSLQVVPGQVGGEEAHPSSVFGVDLAANDTFSLQPSECAAEVAGDQLGRLGGRAGCRAGIAVDEAHDGALDRRPSVGRKRLGGLDVPADGQD